MDVDGATCTCADLGAAPSWASSLDRYRLRSQIDSTVSQKIAWRTVRSTKRDQSPFSTGSRQITADMAIRFVRDDEIPPDHRRFSWCICAYALSPRMNSPASVSRASSVRGATFSFSSRVKWSRRGHGNCAAARSHPAHRHRTPASDFAPGRRTAGTSGGFTS